MCREAFPQRPPNGAFYYTSMLATLLEILSWDLPSPVIMLEQDGDIGLSFFEDRPDVAFDISIAPSGKIAWAMNIFPDRREHGTDIHRVKTLLEELAWHSKLKT